MGEILFTNIGVFLAIFAALLGILYYPIKRFFKNRKQKKLTNEKE